MEGEIMFNYSWGSFLFVPLRYILHYGIKALIWILHVRVYLVTASGTTDKHTRWSGGFMQLARNMNRTEIHLFNKYLWSIVFVQSTEVNICWKIISFTSKGTSAIFQVQFHQSIRQLRQLRHKGTLTKRIFFFFFWRAKTGWYLFGSKLDSIVCEKEGERETEEHFLEKAKISLRQSGRHSMLIPELQGRGEPDGFLEIIQLMCLVQRS